MCQIDARVQGQGHKVLMTSFSLNLLSWTFTHRLPISLGCALLILGLKSSKVKVTMHWLLKMVYMIHIIAFSSHLSSWHFTHRLPISRGCALLISGSKGQRPRSQCIAYWKWLMWYTCIEFPFTPVVTAWIVAVAWIVAGDNSCRCSRHKSSPATIHAVNVSINCRQRQFMPEISLTLWT